MFRTGVSRWVAITLIILMGCDNGPEFTDPEDIVLNEILPETFSIDIPSALSFSSPVLIGTPSGLITDEGIYSNVRTFIALAESRTADLQSLIDQIHGAAIDSALSFSITSDDDGRTKDYILRQRVTVEGKDFRYQLDMDDEDGTRAAQLFWNTSPNELMVYMKPSEINREALERGEEFIMLSYQGNGVEFNETMSIQVTRLAGGFGIDNLHLFVGNKGAIIEVSANFNLPDITLIDPSFTGGRNYAVVGRVNPEENLAVASVALPPSAVDDNDTMFEDFALETILTEELNAVLITDPNVVVEVAGNSTPPAFFAGDNGFVSSGTSIPDNPVFSASFNDLSSMNAFIPRDIRDLELFFRAD